MQVGSADLLSCSRISRSALLIYRRFLEDAGHSGMGFSLLGFAGGKIGSKKDDTNDTVEGEYSGAELRGSKESEEGEKI